MNKSEELTGYILAFMVGFVTVILIMLATNSSPSQLNKYWRETAVKLGHAEWVMNTNQNPPVVEFRWKSIDTHN